jgi:hypothetical protein
MLRQRALSLICALVALLAPTGLRADPPEPRAGVEADLLAGERSCIRAFDTLALRSAVLRNRVLDGVHGCGVVRRYPGFCASAPEAAAASGNCRVCRRLHEQATRLEQACAQAVDG